VRQHIEAVTAELDRELEGIAQRLEFLSREEARLSSEWKTQAQLVTAIERHVGNLKPGRF
jgi:hypothetical protein